MNFEAYLLSKKIDSAAFLRAEPLVWNAWKEEFEQIHPNSFTAQKLYLINPVRRKYQLAFDALTKQTSLETVATLQESSTSLTESKGAETLNVPKPAVPRPAFKPKVAELPKEEKENLSDDTVKPAVPKPTVPRPVFAKPVVKPVETEQQSDKVEEERSLNVPPEVAKPAKPVIPRPVMKPKITPPVQQDAPVEEDKTTSSENTTHEEEKPAVAKPVVPRPVIKPRIVPPVATDTHVPPVNNTEDTPNTETPPAEKPAASKPAMARPVIKPPKPKND